MKNITKNTEELRSINGGVGFIEVAIAAGTIYAAYEACAGAWNLGTWLANKIRGN